MKPENAEQEIQIFEQSQRQKVHAHRDDQELAILLRQQRSEIVVYIRKSQKQEQIHRLPHRIEQQARRDQHDIFPPDAGNQKIDCRRQRQKYIYKKQAGKFHVL